MGTCLSWASSMIIPEYSDKRVSPFVICASNRPSVMYSRFVLSDTIFSGEPLYLYPTKEPRGTSRVFAAKSALYIVVKVFGLVIAILIFSVLFSMKYLSKNLGTITVLPDQVPEIKRVIWFSLILSNRLDISFLLV